ncbi:MAG: hypothetical protein ACYSR0_00510 [Planctomycetota bacterium]|jgi:hypothetical protein
MTPQRKEIVYESELLELIELLVKVYKDKKQQNQIFHSRVGDMVSYTDTHFIEVHTPMGEGK